MSDLPARVDTCCEEYAGSEIRNLPQAEAGLGIGTRWSFIAIDTAL
jgi:hypothetical protein